MKPTTSDIIDHIKSDLNRLLQSDDLDARDRRSIFIATDILANLSPSRLRRGRALSEIYKLSERGGEDHGG